jgi:hypothetical protein
MRRLTLILSDLYLPDEAAGDIAIDSASAMPALEWLLRFAVCARIDDWRSWLARELGRVDLAGPVASAIARTMNIDASRGAWLATPVRLEARLDHVRMIGLARLDAAEVADWCGEFARHVGPSMALHAVNERSLLLTGIDAHATTCDPARLIGTDVIHALPQGEGAQALRRIGAEIEMWLHASLLNDARERRKLPRVSTLWLWAGGGAVPPAPLESGPAEIFGGDAFLDVLRHGVRVAPTGFDALRSAAEHVIVELAPVSSAADERLADLDSRWFAPLRVALATGALGSLDIVANDRRFQITARPGWRFWRRRRGWLESLGRASLTAKA